MLKSRILWQVWGILGITLVISTLVFGVFVAGQAERDALTRIEQTMYVQAQALAPTLAEHLDSQGSIQPEQLRGMLPGIVARVTLINSDGTVIADSNSDPEQMDNHGTRPEVLASTKSRFGTSARYSQTIELSMLYLAIPIQGSAGNSGYLRLALPLTAIENQMTALKKQIALSAVAVGVLFLLIGYALAFRVTNPITRMTEMARSVAKGNYHLRLEENREDEIGQLSVVVNELAIGVQQRIDELTSNRNRLAAVLAGLTEGVISIDLDQRVIHANDSAVAMLGLKKEQIEGKSFAGIATSRELKQLVETCIEGRTNLSATLDLAGRTMECSCVLMSAEEGDNADRAGAIVVLEDTTEKKRLEEVRSDFVANASHELKTPISAVRGLIETIIDDPQMPKEVFVKFAERIRQQTINLERIVQDLLQLSRFDSSEREKVVTRVDLAQLMREVYESRLEDARDHGVNLVLELSSEDLFVQGEEEALNQLVINLVDNAVKYSGDDGRVQMRLLQTGSMATIEIEDNGIGIAQDESQRIFERFYRVDRARSRDLGGTGLGLSIVKHIAQAHQGSVSVKSQLGEGSVFSAQLPLAEAVI